MARITNSTPQVVRDEYILYGAMEELAEAIGASKIGYDDKAKSLGKQAMQAFDTLQRNGATPKIRSTAKRYYDCYFLNKCSG